MIQRKQTLFLLLAFVLTLVCMSTQVGTLLHESGSVAARIYNLWLTDGQGGHSFASVPLFVALLISALIQVVTIFLYHKRKLQATLCLVAMLMDVVWYVLLAVLPQQTGGMLQVEWPAVLPAVSIILTFMARKGVLADEKLVRSLDRIR